MDQFAAFVITWKEKIINTKANWNVDALDGAKFMINLGFILKMGDVMYLNTFGNDRISIRGECDLENSATRTTKPESLAIRDIPTVAG